MRDTGPDWKQSRQLQQGIKKLEEIINGLNIVPVKVIGRVKTKESMKDKLQKTSSNKPQHSSTTDTIGIRAILRSRKELDSVFKALISQNNILFIKDYVNNPRQDGVILNSDPKDIYQSYHIFTDSLNGVPTEVQLRTSAMEKNRLGLAKQYGDEYWKTAAFRQNKYKLGDAR